MKFDSALAHCGCSAKARASRIFDMRVATNLSLISIKLVFRRVVAEQVIWDKNHFAPAGDVTSVEYRLVAIPASTGRAKW